jgi:protease-4
VKRALGAFALVIVIGAVAALAVHKVRARVPAGTILEVSFDGPLLEYVPDDLVARAMLSRRATLRDVVEALERASDDERVSGLVATIGAGPIPLAQVQELRDAILAFRARKKTALAFAESFGEFAPAAAQYYLASAFDEIWLQPSGELGFTGMIWEQPFARAALEKAGLTARLGRRREYKSAMNFFTERKFTAAQREATEALVASMFGQLVRGIARGRRLAEREVRALADRGPLSAPEALSARLVDGLGYRDDVEGRAKKKASPSRLLSLSSYLERAGTLHRRGKAIALIYGVGDVQRGRSDFDPVQQSFTMGSDTVRAAFQAATLDPDVKAILFRVNSPGGSYVASDAIWRETLRARRAGKPVVVSMGELAGSGGYFVAVGADRIVADAATITGSIGVLIGKFETAGFWQKIGVSWDEVHTSEHSTIWTGLRDYSPSEWARVESFLDRIYEDFTAKVAEGRSLPRQRVLEVAKGRIWTGEDARAIGLVDELGGLSAGLRAAKRAARIPDAEDVELRVFPRRKGHLRRLIDGEAENSDRAAAETFARVAARAQPIVRVLRALGLDQPAALRMPVAGSEP